MKNDCVICEMENPSVKKFEVKVVVDGQEKRMFLSENVYQQLIELVKIEKSYE